MAQGRYTCPAESAQLRGTAVYELEKVQKYMNSKGKTGATDPKIEYCDNSGLSPTNLNCLYVDLEGAAGQLQRGRHCYTILLSENAI
jgi:hypothetical protein